MKIVLAPDKYKGSLTGLEFCDIVEPILKSSLNAEVIKAPLADGGDGTIEVVNYYLKGNIIKVEVNNPIFKPVLASYLYSESSKIAFIEMAEASGMKLLKPEDQNCMNTTTFGTGQLVLNAIDKGAKHIILGIGGSATNDCGIGMATALGYRFLDKNNKEVKPIGSELANIIKIDDSLLDKRLKKVKFQIACDVTNPLCGPNGAAYVYAKQKGATEVDVRYLDQGLQSFSKILDKHFILQTQCIKGAGAAGGMGAGTIAFLSGELLPGIDVIKQIAEFDTKIKNADWIITGEGNLDDQTLSGKALSGVLSSAKKKKIKVAAFCGSIDLGKRVIKDLGISYSDSIMNHALSISDALMNTSQYLEIISKEFVKQKLEKMTLYPLKFNPVFSYRIWGGNKLKKVLNKDYNQDSIGESWEISDVENNETIVSEGTLKGKTLKELIKKFKDELVGNSVYETFGNDFPLLIKFIDAKTPLSIQVHPSNELANERHNSFGKNEMWYVMEAEKDAELIIGFNQETDKESYQKHLDNSTLTEILNIEKVSQGDTFYIPTGRVHAIGAGVLLAEIQQTSDITYRIYDYDRVDKITGKKRELHTDLALDAIDFNIHENYKTNYKNEINTTNKLVHSPYFKTNFIHISETLSRDLTNIDSFVIYICVEGTTELNCNNRNFNLNIGETILVPANTNFLNIRSVNVKLLEVFL